RRRDGGRAGADARRCAAPRAPGLRGGRLGGALPLGRMRAALDRRAARWRGRMSSGRSPRTVLLLTAKVVVSLLLFGWLFRRVQWAQIGPALGNADASWVAAAAVLLFASHMLASYQWNRLLGAAGIELPFWKVAAYYHVGLFFNNFLPANVGGDFARTLDASRTGASRASALSTVILDRLIGTVALGGVAVVSTLPAIDRFHLAAAYGGVVAFFIMAVVMLRAMLEPRVLAALERLLARIGLARLSPSLDRLSGSLVEFRNRKRLLLELLCIALIVQVMRIGVHILFARALGISVEPAYFFLFVPLLAVIVSLPISLNGIGVREGAGILLFGMVGLNRASAFALQFGTYLVAVGVSLIGGLVFLARIPGRRARDKQPPPPAEEPRRPRRSTE